MGASSVMQSQESTARNEMFTRRRKSSESSSLPYLNILTSGAYQPQQMSGQMLIENQQQSGSSAFTRFNSSIEVNSAKRPSNSHTRENSRAGVSRTLKKSATSTTNTLLRRQMPVSNSAVATAGSKVSRSSRNINMKLARHSEKPPMPMRMAGN